MLTVSGDPIVARLHLVRGRVHHEVTKLAAEGSKTAHLPVDPVEALLPFDRVAGDKAAVLLREVLHNRSGLEQGDRLAYSGRERIKIGNIKYQYAI
jgi:hypothetical protein